MKQYTSNYVGHKNSFKSNGKKTEVRKMAK